MNSPWGDTPVYVWLARADSSEDWQLVMTEDAAEMARDAGWEVVKTVTVREYERAEL